MNVQTGPHDEKRFDRGSWLTLAFVILLLGYAIGALAYQFTLPTDGWNTNEATEIGFNYTENWMGFPSGLQPGDNVIAVEGSPAPPSWQSSSATSPSPAPHWFEPLQQAWQAGATLDYTVIRDGQELHVPVTLGRWQFEKWLLAVLSDPYRLAGILPGYFLLALGFFVFLRRPGNPTAGAFLVLFATLISSDLAPLPIGLPEWIDPLARVVVARMVIVFFPILLPFALIRFALVFPHPKPILQRLPWLVFAPIAVGVLLNVLFPNSIIGWFWFLLSLALTVGIIVHNAFTMRDPVSRAQILWGLGGLIFGFGLLTLLLLSTTFELIGFNERFNNLVSAAAFMVMGVCLAIAILRYHLFDINIIIRKTLIYSALTLTLALVFFGSVMLMQNLVTAVSSTALRPSDGQPTAVVTVISTLLIAALFTPLRRRIQSDIDRRFYRKKYDAEKMLERFAQSARNETNLESLTVELMGVVEETMQPASVSLWLRTAPGSRGKPAGTDNKLAQWQGK